MSKKPEPGGRIPAEYLKTNHFAQGFFWAQLSDELKWRLLVDAGIIDRKYSDISFKGRTMFLEVWAWAEMTEQERHKVIDTWAELIGLGYELMKCWPRRGKTEQVA